MFLGGTERLSHLPRSTQQIGNRAGISSHSLLGPGRIHACSGHSLILLASLWPSQGRPTPFTLVQCFLSDLTPFDQDIAGGIIIILPVRRQRPREVRSQGNGQGEDSDPGLWTSHPVHQPGNSCLHSPHNELWGLQEQR